ncbi:MAG: hypothetical protein Q8K75_06525 [Chlamydiales bacterium]|nr:hypothetical protein [Chlamydiales bacterium]
MIKFARIFLATAIGISTFLATEAFANPDRSNTGRTLYDRNQGMKKYQRQRAQPCGRSAQRGCYYEDENGDYYYTRRNPYDSTYWAPDAHPDNAGNESQ